MARTAVKRPRGRPRKHAVSEKSPVSVKREPVAREPVRADGPVDVARSTPDVEKKIDQLISDIRKEFGPDSIYRLGEYETGVETFATGSDALDKAIGIGGFPLAKLVQITGAESVGKSTLVNYIAATAQRSGIVVYFVDGEQSEGVDRATAIGVNTNILPISEPDTLEEAFARMAKAIERMKKWDTPSLIILDSVAALPLNIDLARSYDDEARRAGRAIFLSQNLDKLTVPLKGTKIGMIFVNQLREKANVVNPYEKKTYSPGGRKLRHKVDLSLELARIGLIRQAQQAIGITTRIRIEKSKLAPPFKSAEVNLYFDGRVEDSNPTNRGHDERE